MKTFAKWLVRFYPRGWRRRYGAEMEALVEDCDIRGSDAIDLLRGAIVMYSVRWPVIVGTSAIVGALAGLGISFLLPQLHVSSASIKVAGASVSDITTVVQQAMSRRSLTDVIRKYELYPADVQNKPLEDVVDTMRRHIKVTALPATANFDVSFAYQDRTKTQPATAMLVARILEANVRAGLPQSTFELTEPPSQPQRTINPNVATGTIGGLAAGLLLGAVLVRTRRQHAVA